MLPIPNFQPIPFPAPVWLLKAILVIGFYLHAIPMNVALTGGLVAAIFLTYGRMKSHPYAQRLGKTLATALPFFVSVAITQGIVPLLFLQLVYGPLFYTSSILIAIPWISVIFMLLVAYYAYYFYTYHKRDTGWRASLTLFGSGLLFLAIAFMFSNNMTLMLAPSRWVELYQQNQNGLHLNTADPQLLPRYLHFIVAAVAVTGLTIGCFGLYWHNREKAYGQWLLKTGATLFLIPTLLQIPVGIWFLLSLAAPIRDNFLGGDTLGTSIFVAALILDLIGLAFMGLAATQANPNHFKGGLTTALLVIFLMVIMRHLVRVYSVEGFFTASHMAVQPQWFLLALFFASFVIGVIYMGWLIRLTWRAYHQPLAEQSTSGAIS